jgi:hypothetical protein
VAQFKFVSRVPARDLFLDAERRNHQLTHLLPLSSWPVWMHEGTGAHDVVGDGGETAIGPFRPNEILRHWRVASSPTEPVLGIPIYYEHYKPLPLPLPAAEWLEVDPDWLPPSVTFHDFPEKDLELEWSSPPLARAGLRATRSG